MLLGIRFEANRMMMNNLCRGVGSVLIALTIAGCASYAPSPSVPPAAASGPPQSLLWVGNSFFYYNNSMHGQVAQLVRGDNSITHRGVSVTISGSGIDWHDVGSYLGPDRIGKYSFIGDNEIRFNPPGRQFDAVMIMDCSQCPIHPQLGPVFHEYAKKHADTVRANGAKPIFFMSWAYKDKPEMTAQLAEQYTIAGKANGAQVVPAGLAFARSVALKPDLELYMPDKRHPSLAGTYLAACTVYAALFGKSPVGNAHTAGLRADIASHLQQVAWDTVNAQAAR
jgi:hypothetical protein